MRLPSAREEGADEFAGHLLYPTPWGREAPCNLAGKRWMVAAPCEDSRMKGKMTLGVCSDPAVWIDRAEMCVASEVNAMESVKRMSRVGGSRTFHRETPAAERSSYVFRTGIGR